MSLADFLENLCGHSCYTCCRIDWEYDLPEALGGTIVTIGRPEPHEDELYTGGPVEFKLTYISSPDYGEDGTSPCCEGSQLRFKADAVTQP